MSDPELRSVCTDLRQRSPVDTETPGGCVGGGVCDQTGHVPQEGISAERLLDLERELAGLRLQSPSERMDVQVRLALQVCDLTAAQRGGAGLLPSWPMGGSEVGTVSGNVRGAPELPLLSVGAGPAAVTGPARWSLRTDRRVVLSAGSGLLCGLLLGLAAGALYPDRTAAVQGVTAASGEVTVPLPAGDLRGHGGVLPTTRASRTVLSDGLPYRGAATRLAGTDISVSAGETLVERVAQWETWSGGTFPLKTHLADARCDDCRFCHVAGG